MGVFVFLPLVCGTGPAAAAAHSAAAGPVL
jgi:hypothetical protein